MAQRIEIARRDKGCRLTGCLYTEFTDIHHMKHWSKGGLTDLANLITLCGRHHNAVHELGWTMQGDANAEVTFVSPTGQVMVSVPSPTWRRASRSGKSSGASASNVVAKKASETPISVPVTESNQDPGEFSEVRRR